MSIINLTAGAEKRTAYMQRHINQTKPREAEHSGTIVTGSRNKMETLMKTLSIMLFVVLVGFSSYSVEAQKKSASKSTSSTSKEASKSTKTKSSTNTSNEWDTILKDYEKFIDQYIVLYKKAAKGDMSAMSEYPGIMNKANNLGNKLANAKGNLTSSQLSKYTKLQEKLVKAASSL